ncbi:MAG: ABC transporter permease, partial [Clostridiales bacterium]|nr:ABC transporter permease [Clostridiales bacterium]
MKNRAVRFAKEHGCILMYAVLFVAAAASVGRFFTVTNVLNIVKQA